MTEEFDRARRTAIREALGRLAYQQDEVRLVRADAGPFDWLVATHRGLFAVSDGGVELMVNGWFFGICDHDGQLFLFENCGHRDRFVDLGRVIRFRFDGKNLSDPRIIVKGLHTNCHQLAVIDGLLCVVDTANQAIRRYRLDGEPVDVRRPFPVAPPSDRSGAYVHLNSIAKVGDRIGLMLHNGPILPERRSEIAWLDESWAVVERHALPGHHCHDIVEDGAGRLWHTLSREGEVLRSDGLCIPISKDEMTRGIALSDQTMAVGISTFGPRHLRGTLNGSIVLIDRERLTRLREIKLPAAPADLIAI